jgi:hypothetical protein
VVSVTDPYGRILGLLDRSRYLFFQVAPQLYSRGRVDTVPDPLLLGNSKDLHNIFALLSWLHDVQHTLDRKADVLYKHCNAPQKKENILLDKNV